MPFDHPLPRPFMASSIQQFAPQQPGVYGLSNAREWLYIGCSENIQAALLDHMNSAHPSFLQSQPTGFVFEVRDHVQQAARPASLTREYKPTGNHHRSHHR